MRIGRRSFLGAGATLLWAPAPLVITTGCGSRPQTPNAHLYGHEWVSATYEMYGQKYVGLQRGAETKASETYGLLAQRGVQSLDALQTRDVPFFIRANPGGSEFAVERKVPERLTYTSDMTEADRAKAQEAHEKARAHIHTDYEEIRRLNASLTSLMGEIHSVRAGIELGRVEQFQIVRQITALREDPKTVPFELPYQVAPKDYEEVLMLLLERLDDDCERLERLEASMVTVGLTARSTDANSGSLSANLYKVLLAVIEDASASNPREAAYPTEAALRAALLDRGRTTFDTIKKSAPYLAWEKAERAKKFEAIGAMLTAFDSLGIIPLKTSSIFQQVLGFYRGDGDYLSYLKTAASLLPFGGSLTKTIGSAVDTTEEMRRITKRVAGVSPEELMRSPDRLLKAANGKALMNAGTSYGLSRVDKQLAFFKSKKELVDVAGALDEKKLLAQGGVDQAVAQLQGLAAGSK